MLRQPLFNPAPSRGLGLVDIYMSNLVKKYNDDRGETSVLTPMHSYYYRDHNYHTNLTNEEIKNKLLNGETYDNYAVDNESDPLNPLNGCCSIEPQVYVEKNYPAVHSGGLVIGLPPMSGCGLQPDHVYPLITPERFNFVNKSQQAEYTNDLLQGIHSGNTTYLHKGDGHITNAVNENTRGGLRAYLRNQEMKYSPSYMEPLEY